VLLPRLIWHHLRHGTDEEFYRLQAQDAIAWLKRVGVRFAPGTRVLDLGCGTGIFGAELLRQGCRVTFADEKNWLSPALADADFRAINLDRDELAALGRYDVVICSNVLEHLARPERLLAAIPDLLAPGGVFYLSWTNWLSPWGGHDFSPFHYLGPRLGPWLWDRLMRRPRQLRPFENLFPTHIGTVLRRLRRVPGVEIRRVVPRYYPELAFLLALPGLREFLAWNCAVVIGQPRDAWPNVGNAGRSNPPQ
jgi:SAM-dependent methyltransferase